MPNFLELGWSNPRPNDFQGDDERPLKDMFGSIQRFLTFPYVGLRFDGSFSLSGTLATIPMTIKSAAASPFVPGDPYNLYRVATSVIQVPTDFNTWMVLGMSGFLTSTAAANAIRTFTWRINGAGTQFSTLPTRPTIGGVTASVGIISPMRKGDTLSLAAASTDVNEDVTQAEAWVVFLPLA